MPDFCSWLTPARLALPVAALLHAVFPSALRAEIVVGMPDAIVCSVKDPTGTLPWEQLVFYVSARTVDGRTLYKTLTSDPVVLLVSADGVVSGGNLADCDGQAVASLVSKGKAFTFALGPPGRERGSDSR